MFHYDDLDRTCLKNPLVKEVLNEHELKYLFESGLRIPRTTFYAMARKLSEYELNDVIDFLYYKYYDQVKISYIERFRKYGDTHKPSYYLRPNALAKETNIFGYSQRQWMMLHCPEYDPKDKTYGQALNNFRDRGLYDDLETVIKKYPELYENYIRIHLDEAGIDYFKYRKIIESIDFGKRGKIISINDMILIRWKMYNVDECFPPLKTVRDELKYCEMNELYDEYNFLKEKYAKALDDVDSNLKTSTWRRKVVKKENPESTISDEDAMKMMEYLWSDDYVNIWDRGDLDNLYCNTKKDFKPWEIVDEMKNLKKEDDE